MLISQWDIFDANGEGLWMTHYARKGLLFEIIENIYRVTAKRIENNAIWRHHHLTRQKEQLTIK